MAAPSLRREASGSRRPHLVAGTEHGAFYHGIHVQLTSDLWQRLARSFVTKNRGPKKIFPIFPQFSQNRALSAAMRCETDILAPEAVVRTLDAQLATT
jgi:hypothetical protein